MSDRRKAGETVTIRDVARMAGVSPATVSRALNAPDLLAKATLLRVRNVLADSGFVPNMLAGSLATRRTHSIALFVPSVTLTLFEPTIRAIIEQFSMRNQQVLIGFGGTTDAMFNDALTRALARRPDAAIVIGIQIDPDTRVRISELAIPFLQAWEVPVDPIDMSVGYSYEEVGRALAALMLRKGYRRPAMIWGTGQIPALMRQVVMQHLAAADIGDVPCETVHFPGDFKDGVSGFRTLLHARAERPDCILCISDHVAHGVLTEARKAGLSVPHDLAVIGFGDVDFAAGIEPALTTVRVDAAGIGLRSADMIMQRLAGQRVSRHNVNLGFSLIERDSG